MSRTGRFAFAATAALAALAAAAAAQAPPTGNPGAVLDALAGTQASLLDLSLAHLAAHANTLGQARGFVAWTYAQDGRILVSAQVADGQGGEAACRAVVAALKESAEVDPATGAPANPASAWAAFFAYPRIRSIDVDPAWDETVDAMFRIQVTVGQTGDGKGVVCESDLLSPEVTARRA